MDATENLEKALKEIKSLSDPLEKVISIITWVDTHIERRIWTYSDIKRKFAKRTASEILEEGHIHYYDPCVDLDSVVALIMKRVGLLPSFVVFRSYKTHSYKNQEITSYHCVIDVPINNNSYTFILGKSRKGYILTEEIPKERQDCHRLDLYNIDIENTPIFEFFIEGGIENLNILIPGFNYQLYLSWLFTTCSKEKFKYLKAISKNRMMNEKPKRGSFIRSKSKFAHI